MKRHGILFLILVAFAAAFTACRRTDKEGFVRVKLQADSLTVAQDVKTFQWTLCGDRAVVCPTDSLQRFSVFAVPGWEPIDTFRLRQDDPPRFQAAGLFDTPASDTSLCVFDMGASRFSRFSVEKDGARLVADYAPLPKKVYVNALALSDSVLLAGNMDYLEKSYFVSVIDPRSGEKQQDVPCQTFLDDMFQPVNYPYLAVSGDRVAFIYRNYRRIEYFQLRPDGRLAFVRSAGSEYDLAGAKALKKALTPLDGPVDTDYGDRYIYLLENAVVAGKIVASRIEVFDWEGNGLYRLQLDRPANKILADERSGQIYAVNTTLDKDRLYLYDIKKILE